MLQKENSPATGIYGRWKDALALAMPSKTFKERMMYPALAAFFALLAFIFTSNQLPYTELALGAPLADALLCSATLYTPFVYLGALLGGIYYKSISIPRMLALTLTFVLRIITSSKRVQSNPQSGFFAENTVTRLAVSAVMCFAQCGMYLPTVGISGESARVVLSTLITVPALTLLFSIYYQKNGEGKARRFLHELSMLFVFSCAVYCAGGIEYAFVTLDTLLCVFFTLCIAKFGGFARAALYGFVLGYIASPQYFVAFLILGASASLVFSLGTFGACGIAAAGGCISAILIGGAGALMSIVPETVIACAITTPIIRYAFLPRDFPYPLNDAAYAAGFSDNMRSALAELSFIRSLRRASDNLTAVTGAIEEVSAQFKSGASTEENAVDTVYADVCDRCSLCTICHDCERERCRTAIADLVALCRESKALDTDNTPPYLQSHCIRLRELTEYVKNMDKSPFFTEAAKNAPPQISYGSVSKILASVYDKAEQELVFDASAEKSVCKLLYSVGVPFGGVSVVGKTAKRVFVYGADKKKLKKADSEWKKGLKSVFGCDYSLTCADTDAQNPMIFSPRATLKIESAVSLLCKKNERVSGDTVISFNDGDSNFYALIADGCGSGEAASKSSSITAELIRNFMLSGLDEVLAIKLAGESLAPICDECFSTVDLLKIDLTNGASGITKNHAAASYILRSGNVYCCSAQTLPIGIGLEAEPEHTELKLTDGDTVIMVSDGVASENLPSIIGLSADLTPRELAEHIMAKSGTAGDIDDDKSVMVIKISKAA